MKYMCMELQVIPTVGVEGKEGEKRRRAIMKRFSRLVDQTSAKAKFLQAFQSRQDSGALSAGTAEEGTDEGSRAEAGSTAEAASEAGEEEAGESAEAGVVLGGSEHGSGKMEEGSATVKDEGDPEKEMPRKGEAAVLLEDNGKAEIEISSSGEPDTERDADPAELVDLVDSYGTDRAQKLQRIASGTQAGALSGPCASTTCVAADVLRPAHGSPVDHQNL